MYAYGKAIVVFLIIAAISAVLLAATCGKKPQQGLEIQTGIGGQVLADDSSNPISGARVRLNRVETPNKGVVIYANPDGRFEIELAPGAWVVSISASGGFREFATVANVKENKIEIIEARLIRG